MAIGSRIKAERERLNLTQEQFASLAGMSKRVQINYEKDERSPDTSYLQAIASGGADIQYIVTGVMSTLNLNADELQVLNNYRNLDPDTKMRINAFLTPIIR